MGNDKPFSVFVRYMLDPAVAFLVSAPIWIGLITLNPLISIQFILVWLGYEHFRIWLEKYL